jgi:flagellar biosynthesis protein FlhF
MHLKRYRRETVQEALRAVREDLGPDALVLSTRVVPARGVRGLFGGQAVEVTAAAERPPVSETRPPAAADSRASRALSALRVVAARAENPERAAGEIAARLRAVGFDDDLAREVAQAHPPSKRRGATVRSLRDTIAEQLAPLAAADQDFAPVEVFVGPPGVGKTTTIAKIAAQERARRGKRLGLVAADGFRVGAVEQLRLYADIIGAPLAVARTPEELGDALDDSRRTLLIDTPGRSPSDAVSREIFRMLSGRRGVRTHLVLAAGTPKDTVRRTLDRFEDAHPSRLVITKLDEAESLAPLVTLLRERELPISYLGTGQNVPDDLERATPPAIAAWFSGGHDAAEARA